MGSPLTELPDSPIYQAKGQPQRPLPQVSPSTKAPCPVGAGLPAQCGRGPMGTTRQTPGVHVHRVSRQPPRASKSDAADFEVRWNPQEFPGLGIELTSPNLKPSNSTRLHSLAKPASGRRVRLNCGNQQFAKWMSWRWLIQRAHKTMKHGRPKLGELRIPNEPTFGGTSLLYPAGDVIVTLIASEKEWKGWGGLSCPVDGPSG